MSRSSKRNPARRPTTSGMCAGATGSEVCFTSTNSPRSGRSRFSNWSPSVCATACLKHCAQPAAAPSIYPARNKSAKAGPQGGRRSMLRRTEFLGPTGRIARPSRRARSTGRGLHCSPRRLMCGRSPSASSSCSWVGSPPATKQPPPTSSPRSASAAASIRTSQRCRRRSRICSSGASSQIRANDRR